LQCSIFDLRETMKPKRILHKVYKKECLPLALQYKPHCVLVDNVMDGSYYLYRDFDTNEEAHKERLHLEVSFKKDIRIHVCRNAAVGKYKLLEIPSRGIPIYRNRHNLLIILYPFKPGSGVLLSHSHESVESYESAGQQ